MKILNPWAWAGLAEHLREGEVVLDDEQDAVPRQDLRAVVDGLVVGILERRSLDAGVSRRDDWTGTR